MEKRGVTADKMRLKLECSDRSLPFGEASTYSENALQAIREADQKAGEDMINVHHLWVGLLGQQGSGASKLLAKAKVEPHLLVDSSQIESKQAAPSLLTDLNQSASEGRIGPAIGRESETKQLMETLLRMHKSNPVLLGEPGVGKTAVVEGLAVKLAKGDVPKALKGSRIVSLDVGAMVAGTRYRGDLEERMKKLLKDLEEDPSQILFIDEVHVVLGAGGSEGTLDVGGLLKPMLARGQLRMIAATTSADYQRYLTKDPAFERRMQPILIEEPSRQAALEILAGVSLRLEKHHLVSIDQSALEASVTLSLRYMPDRRLPDKAIDLLDQTAASASLAQRKGIDQSDVADIVERWTGVPSGSMGRDERQQLAGLQEKLQAQVIDQPQATETVAKTLQRARVGLAPQNRPLGSFLFCGPTGVGKTELARVLARQLFGSDKKLLRFDMSEYSEPHSASRLIGSAPGYVGYEDGGQLVNALRKSPSAVLLLDEIEKADPSITNLLLQAMEEGQLRDGRGQSADLRNVILIMTSNLGSKWSSHARPAMGFSSQSQSDARQGRLRSELEGFFSPELLGRIDQVVFFEPLSPQALESISHLMLAELGQRLALQGIKLKCSPGVAGWMASLCLDRSLGARPLRSVIREQIEDQLTELMVSGLLEQGQSVHLGVRAGQLTVRV